MSITAIKVSKCYGGTTWGTGWGWVGVGVEVGHRVIETTREQFKNHLGHLQ